jgi:hypothetical protein
VTSLDTPHTNDGSFNESLFTLALVAMRDAGADGFAYFRWSAAGVFTRSLSSGVAIREGAVAERSSENLASFPLHGRGKVDGILAFEFSNAKMCDVARPRLKRFVPTIERVWVAQWLPDTYREVVESISARETELIDSKIAIRARGFLNQEPGGPSLDALLRHVDSVLRPSSKLRTLRQILRELQDEAEERKWADRAKSILRHAHGFSEEEAHAHLRKLSRNSRRPFAEVAREVIDGKGVIPSPEFSDLLHHPPKH